jgi:hypothetical protein
MRVSPSELAFSKAIGEYIFMPLFESGEIFLPLRFSGASST